MNKKLFPFMTVFLIVVAIFIGVGVPFTRANDTTTDPWQQGSPGHQKIYEQAKTIQEKQGPIEFYPSSSSQTKTTLWFFVVSAISAMSFVIIIKLFVKKKNKK